MNKNEDYEKIKKEIKELKEDLSNIRAVCLKDHEKTTRNYVDINHMYLIIDYLKEQINDLKYGR